MSRTGDQLPTPRAVIHKKILDVAESNPSASMEEIASEIGGASTDLVERVLKQYGDPAGEEQDSQENEYTENQDRQDRNQHDPQNDPEGSVSTQVASEPDTPMDENGRNDVDQTELTEKQLKTLRLIEENPEASQSDIAEEFDVTRATISRWLNDIPGFGWTRRREIASEILNGSGIRETTEQEEPEVSEEFSAVRRKLDALERRIDQMETNPETDSPGIDPELAHKVVHASMSSDLITEEEELQLLRELMG